MLRSINHASVTHQGAGPRPRRRAIRRTTSMVGAAAIVLSWAVFPAEPAVAATIPSTGAYVTLTKQAGLLQPDGTCQMGTNLDSEGFLWAAAGTQVCYVLTATNQGPDAATNVQISDSFYNAKVPGTQMPVLVNASSTFTVNGTDRSEVCQTMMANNYFNCGSLNPNTWAPGNITLPAGASMTMQINGTINPLMPNSYTRKQTIANTPGNACFFQTAVNQAGKMVPSNWDMCDDGWVYGDSFASGSWLINSALVTANNQTNFNNLAQQAVGVGDADGTITGPTPAQPTADVRVTKTANPAATVNPGGTITWIVTATNYGLADATGVTVVDNIPAGVTVTSAPGCTPPSGTTLPAAGPFQLTCTAGDLQANTTAGQAGMAGVFNISATVDRSFVGTLSNTATASSTSTDPDTSNNSATTNTTVPVVHDLSVQKTANRATLTAEAGLPVDYTLTVTNAGASAAHNVVVSDPLPTQLNYSGYSISPSGAGTCSTETNSAGQTVLTCNVPSVPADPNNPVVITVNTTSGGDLVADGTPVLNTATVSAPTDGSDPNPNNNVSTWILAGHPTADEFINKSLPAEVQAGTTENMTFNVGVKPAADPNQAGVYVISPLVTDQLPAGMTVAGTATIENVTSQDGTQYTLVGGNCTTDPTSLGINNSTLPANTLYCQIDQNMPEGDEVKITVPVAFSPTTPDGTDLTNTAMIQNTSDGFVPGTLDQGVLTDQNHSNNYSSVNTTVSALADLDGEISISDVQKSAVDCNGQPTSASYNGPGSTKQITVSITNNGNASAVGPSFAIQRSTGALADVSQMMVTMDGKTVSATSLGIQCSTLTQSINCTFPNSVSIAPHDSMQITYPVTTLSNDAPGTYYDFLRVDSTTPDVNYASNNAAAPLVIGQPVTNMCLTKAPFNTVNNPGEGSGGHASFQQNGEFSYALTVAPPQGGNSADANNVVVTDVLPVGLIPLSATSDGGSCTLTGPETGTTTDGAGNTATGPQYTVVCKLGTVSGNTVDGGGRPTTTINIFGTVADQAVNKYYTGTTANGFNWAEQVRNRATMTYNAPGSSTVNNASGSTNVDLFQPVPNLVVTKAATGTSEHDGTQFANPGDSVSWLITVTNSGPGQALDPVINDTFATAGLATITGASIVSASGDAGTATCANGQLPCTAASLAVGGSIVVRVTGTMSKDIAGGTVVANTATAQSDSPDADNSNNQAASEIVALPVADLYTVKTAPETAVPGATDMNWHVLVGNHGPSAASDAVVTDSIPAGVTVTSAPGCTPSEGAGPLTLSCNPGTLNPGDSHEFAITATIDKTFAGQLDNKASITSPTVPEVPNGSANQDNAVTTVNAQADLWVQKTAPETATAGGPVEWDLLAGNYGPSTVTDGVVTDHIPAGVTVTSAPGCTPESGAGPMDLSCSVGTLAADQETSLTINATVNPDFTGSLPNQVTIASPTVPEPSNPAQPGGATNRDDTNTQVDRQVTLWIDKTAPESVIAGQGLQWLVVAGNRGPSTANNVTVTDAIPEGVTLKSVPEGCSPTTGSGELTLTCTVGTLQPGQSVELPIKVDVSGTYGTGTLVNTATVSAPDAASTDATATTEVSPASDLWIQKTGPSSAAGDNAVWPDSDIEWKLLVGNKGPSTVTDAKVTDTLPDGVTVTSVPDGCDLAGQVITCTVKTLAPGDTQSFTIGARVTASGGSLENNAEITTATGNDTDLSSNQASVTTQVIPVADMQLEKTATEETNEGGDVEWLLAYRNNGPSRATDVVITDEIPAGVTNFSAPGCTPDAGDGREIITCNLGTVDADDSVYTIKITATVAPTYLADGNPSPMVNSASINSSTKDFNQDNNTSSAETKVYAEATTGPARAPQMPKPPQPDQPGTNPSEPEQPNPPVVVEPTEPKPDMPQPEVPPVARPATPPAAPATPPALPELPWLPTPPVPSIPVGNWPVPTPTVVAGRNPEETIHIVAPRRDVTSGLLRSSLTATGVARGWILAAGVSLLSGAAIMLSEWRKRLAH